jgi:hypothetical protein
MFLCSAQFISWKLTIKSHKQASAFLHILMQWLPQCTWPTWASIVDNNHHLSVIFTEGNKKLGSTSLLKNFLMNYPASPYIFTHWNRQWLWNLKIPIVLAFVTLCTEKTASVCYDGQYAWWSGCNFGQTYKFSIATCNKCNVMQVILYN